MWQENPATRAAFATDGHTTPATTAATTQDTEGARAISMSNGSFPGVLSCAAGEVSMATRVMRAVRLKPDPEFLGNIPIFGGLTEQQLEWIIDAGTVGDVEAGDEVINEGDPARSVLVVCEGELEICKRGGHGGEVRLAVLKAGDCLGEMSLIDIQPRSATARALTGAVLFRLSHADIARLYSAHPQVYTMLVMNIAREISRRLRVADQVLADMNVPVQAMWRTAS